VLKENKKRKPTAALSTKGKGPNKRRKKEKDGSSGDVPPTRIREPPTRRSTRIREPVNYAEQDGSEDESGGQDEDESGREDDEDGDLAISKVNIK
jgi:hypothetical protein